MLERMRNILTGKTRRGAALALACAVAAALLVPMVSCTQKTETKKNRQTLKEYFEERYSVKKCSCIYTDLTHDGQEELVVVELWQDAKKSTRLSTQETPDAASYAAGQITVLQSLESGEVSELWKQEFASADGLWERCYLYRKDGEDYLLWYQTDRETGAASYRLFSPEEGGSISFTARGKLTASAAADGTSAEKATFDHAVSTYLHRAGTLIACEPSANSGKTAQLSCLADTFTHFSKISGDPSDAPKAVQTIAKTYVKNAVAEMESSSSENTALGTEITESQILKLEKAGTAAAPDKSGTVDVWRLSYQLKLKDPDSANLAGDPQIDEAGWWIFGDGMYEQPLLGTWKDAGGHYTKIAVGNEGTLSEESGTHDFYAAELLREYAGQRPDSVEMSVYDGSQLRDATYTLRTVSVKKDTDPDAAWSIYVAEDWQQEEPERTDTEISGQRELVRRWHAAEKENLSVSLYRFDGLTSLDSGQLRTVLTAAAADIGTTLTDYDPDGGNLNTSGGVMTQRSAQTVDGDILRAFAVDDGSGCWAVVTRCPKAELEASESWTEIAAMTFCVQRVSELDAAVSGAILATGKKMYAESETQAEGHQILESAADGALTTVYALAEYGGYEFQNGNFVKTSGSGVIPTVLTFRRQDGAYTLKKYQEPEDGAEYENSVRKLFPEKLWTTCLQIGEATQNQIIAEERAQAREYLASINRSAEVGDFKDFSDAYPLLTDRGVSEEVSNRLDDTDKSGDLSGYPTWIGTRERLENGTRYVYEMSYDAENHQIVYKKYAFGVDEPVKKMVYDSLTGKRTSEKS